MTERILLLFFLAFSPLTFGQNCTLFSLNGDSLRYKACLKCEESKKYYQFTRNYQMILNEAIEIDPDYATPYAAKSVAYLKSGDFISWKQLIDKAVECDELEYLGYRASCRYQFFRDYKGCINDIERLDSLVIGDIGEIHNGDYHLNVIKAICYDALGETKMAIQVMEEHLMEDSFFPLLYDYLLLGYFHLKQGNYLQAEILFHKQKEVNNIAENDYYLAKTYSLMNRMDASKKCLIDAKANYQIQYRMTDPYTEPYAKVYLSDIDSLLEEIGID